MPGFFAAGWMMRHPVGFPASVFTRLADFRIIDFRPARFGAGPAAAPAGTTRFVSPRVDQSLDEQQNPAMTETAPAPTLSDPRALATAGLFRRYAGLIEAAMAEPDPFPADPRLALENLLWMCRTGADEAETLPIDKVSRWLGFVQGCLAMRGLVSVDAERDATRPIFHAAYAALGLDRPATRDADRG